MVWEFDVDVGLRAQEQKTSNKKMVGAFLMSMLLSPHAALVNQSASITARKPSQACSTGTALAQPVGNRGDDQFSSSAGTFRVFVVASVMLAG